MIMGYDTRTSGHERNVNRPYRCPKVLGKPIHEDKSSPRHSVDAGTYSFRESSYEFPRFRDITEYSTNANIIPTKSYRHLL